MAADPERDLVFLPTTSPSPDFYGGLRSGDNAFANSVVALRAFTGAFVWGFQTVRHDLWDYVLAAQPLLFEHTSDDGERRPAVAHAGKTGFVFVLDRETGEPLHPVEERSVPQSDVPGEQAAKTQPFPKLRLHATDARPLRVWDLNAEHRAACESRLDGIRYDGIFTPPSLEGSLVYPGNIRRHELGLDGLRPGLASRLPDRHPDADDRQADRPRGIPSGTAPGHTERGAGAAHRAVWHPVRDGSFRLALQRPAVP